MTAQERRAKGAITQYKWSRMHSLDDAYGRYSEAKKEAWGYCEELCKKHNGACLKVVSKNANFFTAGFPFMQNGRRKFMYITKSYDTIVDFD